MPPAQQFSTIADLGRPEAICRRCAAFRAPRRDQCLANEARDQPAGPDEHRRDRRPINIPGTPTFLINGEVVDETATWELLEPKLKEALGS